MRIAVYSDAHANLPAMQAFIKHSADKGVQCYEFLGDAVNYGGKPEECLNEIIKLGLIGHVKDIDAFTNHASIQRDFIETVYKNQLLGKILLGNNDAACCGLEDPDYFVDCARDSALITRKYLLSEWHQQFLRERPMEVPMNICNETVEPDHEDRVFSVRYNHSAPGNLHLGDWHYIRPDTNIEYIEHYFEYFQEKICLVGHSHTPCAFVQVNGQSFPVTFPLPTKNYDKAIINVGTIGQPRQNETRGSYVIIDSVNKTIDLEWFTYDIRKAMNDILDKKLPDQNAQRLLHGKVIKNFKNTDSGTLQI